MSLRRVVLFTALALGGLAVLAPPGHASEGPEEATLLERIKAFESHVKEHRRAKAGAALLQDVQSGIRLHAEASAEEKAERLQERIVKSVGSLTKIRDDKVQIAALKALGTMKDDDGARFVKPHLKVLKNSRDAKVVMTAIGVAGQIGDDSLVAPLLKIVDKAKYYAEAAAAMKSLGKFGHSKRLRTKILSELATTLRKDVPGGPTPGKESQATSAYIPGKAGNSGTSRWQTLSPVLPAVLNELTGMQLTTAEDWMDLVQDSKRNLGALFMDD